MKIGKKFLSLFLCIVFLCSGLAVNSFAADEFTYGDYSYTVSSDKVTIVSYPEQATGAVNIPSKIDGKEVVAIDDGAFQACTLITEVIIPDTVKTIGKYAFAYCVTLKSVTIPSSVTSIGKNAFQNSKSVTIKCESGSYAEKYATENGIIIKKTAKVFNANKVDNNSFFHFVNTSEKSGFNNVTNYEISDSLLRAKLIQISLSNKSEFSALLDNMEDSWNGSCYGIAATMGMVFKGYNQIDDISSKKASNYYEMCSYGGHLQTENRKLLDTITFYQLLQNCNSSYGPFSSKSTSTYFDWAWKIVSMFNLTTYNNIKTNKEFWKSLIQKVKDEYMVLLSYGYSDGGHAVVTCGLAELPDGTVIIKIYDENNLGRKTPGCGEYSYITIKGDKAIYTDYDGATKSFGDDIKSMTYTSFSDLPKVSNSDFSSTRTRTVIDKEKTSRNMTILIDESDDFVLKTAKGEIKKEGENVESTLKIFNISRQLNGNKSQIALEVEQSKYIKYIPRGINSEIVIYDEGDYYRVSGKNISAVDIDLNGEMKLQGTKYSFVASVSKDELMDSNLVKFYGTAKNEAAISVQKEKVSITSTDTISNLSVKKINSEQTEEIIKNENKKEQVVSLINKSEPTIGLSDFTINYKCSAKINPKIDVEAGTEYSVSYTSSNPKVATVDENGKVYGAKKGSATITCTVTDSNGNTVQDTCKVTVKYSFGQWLIKILLFGWIWY